MTVTHHQDKLEEQGQEEEGKAGEQTRSLRPAGVAVRKMDGYRRTDQARLASRLTVNALQRSSLQCGYSGWPCLLTTACSGERFPRQGSCAAYRKVALEKHPDKAGAAIADAAQKFKIEEEFKGIQEAYETLSDPARRREYDSTDTFDDTLPSDCSPEDFFKVKLLA